MLILGIDPGTAITGYGLVESDDSSLTLVTYGVILTPAKTSLPSRLQTIYQELLKLLETYQPQEAAVEELFLAKMYVRRWQSGTRGE